MGSGSCPGGPAGDGIGIAAELHRAHQPAAQGAHERHLGFCLSTVEVASHEREP
jgi:hypothetical protein